MNTKTKESNQMIVRDVNLREKKYIWWSCK